jgi:hypothetical protein
VPLLTAGIAAQLAEQLGEPQEIIYDGANMYLHVADSWTGFFLGDSNGPRGVNDPLWPLDALFGARQGAEIGSEPVRGVQATRFRVTIDLAGADAALATGIIVPSGPYRGLNNIPAEVWLDSAGRARRIAVSTEQTSGSNPVPIWSVVELWDFGVAADITAPQAADVVPPREAYGRR